VIAEGVERPEQRARLEEMGCALGQGPGLAGPLSASELESMPGGRAEDLAGGMAGDQAGDTACTTTC
jgi:predicted signal transduction protein with EAL and GGDEF domain